MNIPVFYDERMNAPPNGYSPSPSKPALVVADWIAERPEAIGFFGSGQATIDELILAHSPSYVHGVLNCITDNGHGTRSPEIARSLPWLVGSMVHAARWAADRGRGFGNLACSPSSGFHHARYNGGAGFCTFNGLMVAANVLLKERLAERVGILDCDYHYGDGTEDIITITKARHVVHRTHLHTSDEAFFTWLRHSLVMMRDCDIVLYQAGADMHIDDPLGGLLTTEQMRQRDQIVFRHQSQYCYPMVWNLAGGYQVDADGSIGRVLGLHRITLDAAIDAPEPS